MPRGGKKTAAALPPLIKDPARYKVSLMTLSSLRHDAAADFHG